MPTPSGETAPTPAATASSPGTLTITIPPDEIANAQIKTEVAVAQSEGSRVSGNTFRTTGTVTSNAYKETPVFPIAGGVVKEVKAKLGDRVKIGQLLATIFSTDLANAQGEYLKMLAEHDEHEREHHRTEQLVEIGAASREELEQSRARIAAMDAQLASSRQQLVLYGMSLQQIEALRSPSQVNSSVPILSPVSGTVIARGVNQAEVVEKNKEAFRIADLSSMWVIAQVYEKDLPAVRLGASGVITAPSIQGRTITGRVSYIDSRIDPQTRTAQIRIEVPNPGEVLKIGMFVDVNLGGTSGTTSPSEGGVIVPKIAIQSVGSTKVVFISTNQPGVFVQRAIKVKSETDRAVVVESGLDAGERVVSDGSFLLRAESLKRNPDQTNFHGIKP
ncbi:MAG TPA: efflux RND transporter periplasmic adaptor subunit [Blastocatellia bacterium]|nr:efflux RND transporter periplasmic adaptor subunit [Blastocatellia bacterium]